MKHNFRLLLIFVCAAQLTVVCQSPTPLVSYAGSRDPLDLAKLTDGSDLIVVAEVSKLLDSPGQYFRDEESHKAKLYAAEVTVREVLKGNIQPGKILVGGLLPITPTNRNQGGPLLPNTVKIIFLKKEGNWWKFSDPFFAVMVAAPVTPRPQAIKPFDKVMEQLLAALQSELLSSEEKRDVISSLRGSNDPRIVPALKAELEKSRDDLITYSLLSSLILRDDATALQTGKKMLETSTSRYGGLLISAISKLNRVDLLPVLVAGTKSPVQSVRVISASSLALSPFPEAQPYVLTLLDDPNRRLVTQLMLDLSSRYKQPEWGPEWDDDKRWEEMHQHWRQFLQGLMEAGK